MINSATIVKIRTAKIILISDFTLYAIANVKIVGRSISRDR